MRDLARRDVRVVLDRKASRCVWGSRPACLVSPNQREAEQLVGQELEDDDDFLMALDAISEMGARNVLITLENGCFRAAPQRPEDEAPARVRAARRAGVRGWLWRRSSGAVSRRDRRRALSRRRGPAGGRAGAASVREVGAGRFDPAFAATLAGDIELAELQPVRS